MLPELLLAGTLVAVTVAVHAVGLAALLGPLTKLLDRPPTRFWPITWLLVRVTWWLIFIHLVAISIWGGFFYWQECVPDSETAFYFSGVTYTTIGYGDVVLPVPWRMLGPLEGLTGILMCGLSAGVFFTVVSRVYPSHFVVEAPTDP